MNIARVDDVAETCGGGRPADSVPMGRACLSVSWGVRAANASYGGGALRARGDARARAASWRASVRGDLVIRHRPRAVCCSHRRPSHTAYPATLMISYLAARPIRARCSHSHLPPLQQPSIARDQP